MDCGIPFCHSGCPLGNLIPEWNDLAWKGRLARRHRAPARHEQLPGVHRPAVPGAVRDRLRAGHQPAGRDDQAGRGHASSTKAFVGRGRCPQAPERLSGKTVAVVGSGPAGLAVAQQLTRAGHTVAVFERADNPAGLLRYGIPEFKMEKAVLDRRLAQMEAEGTRFRSGVDVGVDLTGAQLRSPLRRRRARHRRHRAARPAGAGRELRGIHQAMDYLPQANRVALGQPCQGRSWPPARTSSSSAVATPAPTASAPRCARGPAR
jgi:glutamate synthase (NADPH/NADH) small chain